MTLMNHLRFLSIASYLPYLSHDRNVRIMASNFIHPKDGKVLHDLRIWSGDPDQAPVLVD